MAYRIIDELGWNDDENIEGLATDIRMNLRDDNFSNYDMAFPSKNKFDLMVFKIQQWFK